MTKSIDYKKFATVAVILTLLACFSAAAGTVAGSDVSAPVASEPITDAPTNPVPQPVNFGALGSIFQGLATFFLWLF